MAGRTVSVSVALAVAARGSAANVSAPLAASSPVGSSSTFLQLFEWKWSDVALECEQWLGPKGFTAVQISPAMDHIQGDQWWTRYQPVTYELTSRSGNEAEFTDMVQRCNKAGVGVYADGVWNHIAAGSGTSLAGHSYGDRSTPIYTQEDMHHNSGDDHSNCAVNNYADKNNVQYCDLVGLPDLCTACDKVQTTVAAYIDHMAQIGIAGIRVDAAKHQDAGELTNLLHRAKSGSSLYLAQEVISGAGEAVKPDMYFSLGGVTEFNFARQVSPNFVNDGKLQYFSNFGEAWGLMPTAHAVTFIDNHDTQRGEAQLTYKNGKLYQLASIFMLAHPYGYPKLMSSYAFDSHDQGPPSTPVHSGSGVACSSQAGSIDAPWICEHRWTPLANMVAWRRSAGTNGVVNFQAPGGDTIAFCRGQTACVALNRQESATWSATVKFDLPAGKYCNVIVSDDVSKCPTIEVASDGSVSVQVPPLGAVAAHVGKKVSTETVVSISI